MKSSTKNQTKGAFHEAKGRVKETVGKIIDDPSLEAEGLAEKVAGKIQKKVGQTEKVLED
ncbi:MAG: CsbD family protein [Desulfomicrobium sp.]